MRFDTLDAWLAWQETLHPKAIDLGLDRIRAVAGRMALTRPAPVVIIVAGTNGKGSCVVMLDAMLRAAGYRSGAYTSPHLLRYNERIVIEGQRVGDGELCSAFERVDQARDDISLSYFEFGTLAAFDLMERAKLDVAVLEVGLGGRLDAVNIVDADCALISTIGLDHTDWLGPDRNSVAREKAGIMRKDRPVVCGERDPPASLLAEAERVGADLKLLGRDFDYEDRGTHWTWIPQNETNPLPEEGGGREAPGGCSSLTTSPSASEGREFITHPLPEEGGRPEGPGGCEFPKPSLPGGYQLANAACCLQTLACLSERLQLSDAAIARGLTSATLPGRMQRLEVKGVEVILDVAHNPQAAAALASALERLPRREPRLAVFAQLHNKDHRGVAAALKDRFSAWYTAKLEGERAYSAESLRSDVKNALPDATVVPCDGVANALDQALSDARGQGRVVVFGSFLTVEAALKALARGRNETM